MDFVLIGFIIVIAFVLAVISPHPEVKSYKKTAAVSRSHRFGGDVAASSKEPTAPAHPTTRAA